jgi:hopanoid biosynthesis associated protein HpnK
MLAHAPRDHAREQPPQQLHLIADDFGRSIEINEAIIKAHRRGTITGASLMVTGPACEHAVWLAKRSPELAVGLHLVAAGGRACLPPAELPDLVDAAGQFPADPLWAGLRFAFGRSIREQLARELRAQFERFQATGLPLAHIDGHMHMHLHPTVFRLLLPLLAEYRVPRVRLPRDAFWPALACDRHHLAEKAGWAAVFAVLSYFAARRLKALGIATTERTYGLFQSGDMRESYVARLLNRPPAGSAEIYFHPTSGRRLDRLGPNPVDYATLLSPRIGRLVADRQAQLKQAHSQGAPSQGAQPKVNHPYVAKVR